MSQQHYKRQMLANTWRSIHKQFKSHQFEWQSPLQWLDSPDYKTNELSCPKKKVLEWLMNACHQIPPLCVLIVEFTATCVPLRRIWMYVDVQECWSPLYAHTDFDGDELLLQHEVSQSSPNASSRASPSHQYFKPCFRRNNVLKKQRKKNNKALKQPNSRR